MTNWTQNRRVLDATLGPGTKHLEALQRRHQSYAIHFVLDCGMDGYPPANAEPTDENLALALRNCTRPPRPDEYPAIRMHVDTYRMAQMSATDAIRDKLRERAGSYSRDARTFTDMMPKIGFDQVAGLPAAEDCKRYAVTYRTIVGELRKIAASL